MNIIEAIKKAGPGGQIRQYLYRDDDWIQLPEQENSDGSELSYLSFESILATDWETKPKRREVWVPISNSCGLSGQYAYPTREEAQRRLDFSGLYCACTPIRFVEAEE